MISITHFDGGLPCPHSFNQCDNIPYNTLVVSYNCSLQ
ncbi:hypothetical protein CWATWH0402_510 [Crocosphaera watsonii WH 0402]|uniref:Uncharacterized protein n=2 Tax=Crocosphaera watsonii TaxID=263511 RepID=T2JPW1_CROWT|nr:hypothetical protein CWATWH0005_3897 [Crocosphaera watsonii WH 0005]CCQ67081.1 hypothetical protein CWATWH0402_510 [Crocosphaera watsonii WH 0402]